MSEGGINRAKVRIAVAGGGIVGLAAAWRLAQAGFAITVYDKARVGGEASWAGAGMLSPGGEVEDASGFSGLLIRSRRLYRDFVRELEDASGIAIDYQECGALELAYSEKEFQRLEARAALQEKLGISSKPLAVSNVSKFWPRVRISGLVSARFYPEDGVVDPRQVTRALDVVCRQLHVSIAEHCRVTECRVAADRVLVFSDIGQESFDAVIIAAGAWSSDITVHSVSRLPRAQPVKGHLIGYQQPVQTCNTIVRHRETYVLQRATGFMIAGASVEHVGFDRSIRPDVVAQLAQNAEYVFPHLADTTPSELWTGFRPGSDALHIGSWHSNRVYLAYGHFRNGILLAPVTAELLTAEISANLGT